jgi:broad specificity phosphatase PhoE
MKKNNLAIVRHWIAEYKNLEVNERWFYKSDQFKKQFEFTKDLKPETLEWLSKQAQDFIAQNFEELKSKSRIHFWTSPYWRTIETTNIFLKEFEDAWLNVEKICIFEKIWEVKNFLWEIFSALVDWKEVEIEWKKVCFDKTKTNPKNLNYSNYFFNSEWLNIDKEYLHWLNVFDRINSIESYDSVTNRSKIAIDRILNLSNKDNLVLFFSHQAFTDWLTVNQENYKKSGQSPGQTYFINEDRTYKKF